MHKSNHHCFTRDGVTYDCYAHKRRTGEATRCWRITANGAEHQAFDFAGDEITSRDDILAFEDRVVAFVTDASGR
ncbi:MAG: hypothetical protein ACO1Q7_15400 [Gemmatimonas sp.]